MTRNSSRRLWGVGLAVAVALAITSARGDDAPAHSVRLRPLQEIADGTSMEAVSPAGRVKVEHIATPIYTYDDPARQYTGGAIWAWGQPGRPAALMTLTTMSEPDGSFSRKCEMVSLASVPLSASIPPDWSWEPADSGLVPRPLPKATTPAADEARRLRQMKEQARRFRAFEYFAPSKLAAIERYELRLLPQPVFRYTDPGSGLIEGAIFFMAYGTNPEVAILIEASRDGASEASWTYGLARMGRAELHVTLDGGEVWTQKSISTLSIYAPYTGYNRRNVPDH